MDLKEKYEKKVRPALMKKYSLSSPLAVPRISKVVVNTGIGRVREDKDQEIISRELALITGQKPSARPARKSIASFKTRQGMTIGYKVTLRGKRMYDFLSRLLNVALPRTRDFGGLEETSVDERGNLTIGIREQIVFPEMSGEDLKNIFGLEVSLVTDSKNRELALQMYKLLGVPPK